MMSISKPKSIACSETASSVFFLMMDFVLFGIIVSVLFCSFNGFDICLYFCVSFLKVLPLCTNTKEDELATMENKQTNMLLCLCTFVNHKNILVDAQTRCLTWRLDTDSFRKTFNAHVHMA